MDARASRYHESMRIGSATRRYSGRRRRQTIDWYREAEEGLRPGRRHLRPLVSRGDLQHLLQRARPPCACGARRSAGDDLRFARHQYQADLHLRPAAVRGANARRHAARFRRRKRRPRHPLHADGAGGGVRHAGLRAHRRHSLGGVRRLCRRRNSPPASTTASRRSILSASCGIEGARVMPYKPLLDEAISLAKHKPQACMILQRPQCEAPLIAGRDHDWAQGLGATRSIAPRRSDCVPVARHRSALHPLHVRHDRHSEGRGARQWRPHGRAQMVDAESLRRSTRRGVVVGLRHRLGGRPHLHRLRAAAAWLHVDPLRGQAGRHARRRRFLARDLRARRVSLFTAPDRVPRDQEGRPEGRIDRRNTTCRNSARCFSPASAPIPPTVQWAEEMLKVPVIDHWWQTETGWCIAGNPVGLGMLPVKHGSPTVPMPGYDVRVVDEAAKELPRQQDGLDRGQAAAAAGVPADACGSRTSACAKAISRSFPATTRPPTPATSTRTATSM